MVKDDSNRGESARAPSVAHLLERACWAAVSNEHARWAGELHDTIAQDLSGLILHLRSAHGAMAGGDFGAACAGVERALVISRDCLRELRRFMRESPTVRATPGGLGVNLREWMDGLERAARLRFYVRLSGDDGALDRSVQGELLRIAQEAVTNAVRHSGADRIRITWRAIADYRLLCIEDNGVGFDTSAAQRQEPADGMGLRILSERARRIGAELSCHSVPGKGTRIAVRYPLPAAQRYTRVSA